jgi:hypothetical protein
MTSTQFLFNPITGVLDRSAANQNANQAFTPSQTVATTGNLNATYSNGTSGVGATLTNAGSQTALVIDGVTLSAGQTVLVKNQSTQAYNGLYQVTATGDGSHNWILTRAVYYDVAADVVAGQLVPVQSGSTNANTLWMENNTVGTMGTDPIAFTQFSEPSFSTTEYAVLVGGASNTVANIGPNSQVGLPLVSGGSSANPYFGSALVSVTTPGSYPYLTLSTDGLILIDTSSARTVNLMASPPTGILYRIKDNVGDAGINPITIVPNVGTIDGASSASINADWGGLDLIYNGTQWNIC